MDVTMLAADMGATEITSSHLDTADFLAREFTPDSRPFNLIICGGLVESSIYDSPTQRLRPCKTKR